MSRYMNGTTSSSLFEAKLGREKFGGETHAYSVAWSAEDILELKTFADKIIFNSASQLERFYPQVADRNLGLRVNPGISHSHFDLADPARRESRLGVCDVEAVRAAAGRVRGLMFHVNCENEDFDAFAAQLEVIGSEYGGLLRRMEWVSLGGGIAFTGEGYPLERFAARLKAFSEDFGVQVYLEPGEAAVLGSGFLVAQVQDIVQNEANIAIVDAAVETHMLDNLVYGEEATLADTRTGPHRFTIAGNTCLAGDIWGTYDLPAPLAPGYYVVFDQAARYTMVKMNWFNGVRMPSIIVRRLDGSVDAVREFTYDDFVRSLS